MTKWWLISWTTCGTWLPGDKRGYCTWRGKQYIAPPKRYAHLGEAIYRASEHTHDYDLAKSICDEPVYLTRNEMEIAMATMITEIAQIAVVPAIISVGEWHVHWLCHFGKLKIRPTVSRVKAAATRELNAFVSKERSPGQKAAI
jgi:hypothetical protein